MKKILLIGLFLSILTACSFTKKDLGLEKNVPDASEAKAQDELILPPNYNHRPVMPMARADNKQQNMEL